MSLQLRDGELVRVEQQSTTRDGEQAEREGVATLAHIQANGVDGIHTVRLVADDDALLLQDWIQMLSCIEITFGSYTDGRGYSQARLLRERLEFTGEIRAAGDVRVDQLSMMIRCGIDAFALSDTDADTAIPPGHVQSLPGAYSAGYQTEYQSVR